MIDRPAYDGWGDLDQYSGVEPCIDCGAHGLCECWRDELDLEDHVDMMLSDDYVDGADLEDQVDMMLSDRCPICGEHNPYACECGCNDPDAVPFSLGYWRSTRK